MDDKEKIEKRELAGKIYLVLGIIIIFFSFSFICPELVCLFLACLFNKTIIGPISWCIGWSFIGGGAGLINTRTHPQSENLHLVGYWGFVLLTVSIFSFVVSLYSSGEYPDLNVRFYSLSALLGLIGGFLGDIFRELVLKILDKFKPTKKD